MMITYRYATPTDVAAMHAVRMSVRENALSNPMLVQEADYLPFLSERGRGWVACDGNDLAGFAIVDCADKNVWALFIHPDQEAKGIGKELHRLMLEWYFDNHDGPLWLSTAYDTRADRFYPMQGWRDAGPYNAKERRYEMSREEWKKMWER